MKTEGLEIILQSIKKTTIKEVEIKSKLTQVKIVRKDEEINNLSGKHIPPHLNQQIKPVENKNNSFDICSPQIGFFNRYNPKTKKQYFKLRDIVKKGDIVGTVVSMHIHNEIISNFDGKITEILVEQDQPVEYNQPVIRLTSL